MHEMWWRGVFHANAVLESVTDAMLDGEHVVLILPNVVPWYDTLGSEIGVRLEQRNSQYRLDEFEHLDGDIASWLFEQYCPRNVRQQYCRKDTLAQFLAKTRDLVLHNRYVRIKDVTEDRLQDWAVFLKSYRRSIPKGKESAVFLLETHGEVDVPPRLGLRIVRYDEYVSSFDQFAFCALAGAMVDIDSRLRPYLAELASSVGGHDTELSAACLEAGQAFLEDPRAVLKKLESEGLRSDGVAFDIENVLLDLDQRIWKSQVKVLFPHIQQWMSALTRRYERPIRAALPMQTACGNEITEPGDVEPGPMLYLVHNAQVALTADEYYGVCLSKKVRNSLAHMHPINFEDVEKVLALEF